LQKTSDNRNSKNRPITVSPVFILMIIRGIRAGVCCQKRACRSGKGGAGQRADVFRANENSQTAEAICEYGSSVTIVPYAIKNIVLQAAAGGKPQKAGRRGSALKARVYKRLADKPVTFCGKGAVTERVSFSGKKTTLRPKTSKAQSTATWCRRPDSNRHGVFVRRILSPLRLPIPPLRLNSYLEII
jgi:hypothetical protein